MVAAVDLHALTNPDAERAYVDAWRFLSGADLATELPPIAWTVEALGIAPGAVTIVGGAGFGGKTVSMQSLALSVASGTPAWGQFAVKRGRVVHLDYEQGRHLTQTRYQRLARSMGLQLANCDLTVSCLPKAHLDDPHSYATMCRVTEGATVCVIDAFRGAFPKAQENDSSVRSWLDMLQHASDRTECAMLVIAHSRKMSDDVDVRSSLRGSGALFDAAQTVYMLDGSPNRPTKVHNTKDRILGESRETFGLAIEDEEGVTKDNMLDRRWGLKVSYRSAADVQAAYAVEEGVDNQLAINAERLTSIGKRIGDILAGSPNGLSAHTLRGLLHMSARPADINAVLPVLIDMGAVRSEGSGLHTVYHSQRMREPGED